MSEQEQEEGERERERKKKKLPAAKFSGVFTASLRKVQPSAKKISTERFLMSSIPQKKKKRLEEDLY